jgi:hypothetical protein
MLRGDLVSALTSSHIIPGGDRPWSEQQRWVVEAGSHLLELGMDSESIARLARMAWSLAALEVDAAVHEVGTGISTEEAFERQRGRRRAISRMIAAVRHGALAKTMNHFIGIGKSFHHFATSGQHVPSPAFSQRYSLLEQLTDSMDRVRQNPDNSNRLIAARMLLFLGRRKEAQSVIQPIVEQGIHGRGLAFHGALCASLGDMGNAWESNKLALQTNPNSAFVIVCNALVRACQAGNEDEVIAATNAVSETLLLLDRSQQADWESPMEALEVQLLRGRLYLLMPKAFKVADKGITDLKAVIEGSQKLEQGQDLGIGAIMRLRAAFDLAGALSSKEDAVEMYRQVIIIDPGCTLAEKAYRRISSLERPQTNG